MFAYIDPTVRARLVAEQKLIRIDAQGNALDPNEVPDLKQGVILNVLGPIPLPIDIGGEQRTFQWYAFVRHTELQEANRIADSLRGEGKQHLFSVLSNSMSVNSVLVLGDFRGAESPLVRVHSCCLTGDVFGSKRCECGPQLERAFQRIDAEGTGAVIYMSGHEGRGIGLWAKAVTYVLQDCGQDTYQANRSLGLPDDSRDFSDAATILLYLRGDRPVRLMSNNPRKLADLQKGGLHQIHAEKHVTGVTAANRRYLDAKRTWGHTLDPSEIGGDE
ncbi:GTP cyclohydrolase II [Povalibacter uvarum]|uniref:GTP cyclohydrolase II n=1 Tax=Povalibacter uvarum TaxID=732238 RepID=A0A841HJI0_9GAMM|nr:GTP cyclohydrolase II [Povalibacter uvarum]MBB6092539.1 GTP cyclohydrolase II [Povalibacter uvarum]